MADSKNVVWYITLIILMCGPVISLDSNSTSKSSNTNGSTPQTLIRGGINSDLLNVSSFPDVQQLRSLLGNGSLALDIMSSMFRQLMSPIGNGTSSASLSGSPIIEQILKSQQMAMLLATPIGQQLQGILADGGPGKYLTSAMSKFSTSCQSDVQILLGAISKGEGWALKFLDAIGKPPSGILDGQLLWLGSYDQCVDAKTFNTTTEFRGQYCLADIQMTGILPSMPGVPAKITFALCVPDTCQLNGLGLPLLCDKKESFLDDQSAVAITAVVSVLGAIILLATMYDVIRQLVLKKTKMSQVTEMDFMALPPEKHMNGFTNPPSYSETNPDKPSSNKYDMNPEQYEQGEPGIIGKLLLSFSIYTNGRKLLCTQQTSESLTAVNGIRFLSMSWVILGHTLTFAFFFQENAGPFILKAYKEWTFMAISNATVSVDTFFALSGLLVAYLSLREMQKVGSVKKFNWIMYYFHRYWRLTPPYMLFLFFYSILFPYLGNGPYWFSSSYRDWEMCKESWWTNILYVNNLVKTDKLCMGWAWYLANDMQFYILSPLILIPLFVSPVVGGIMSMIFLIITTVVPGVIAAQKHYSATYPDISGNPAMVDYFDKVYIKPYCRMGPYIIGLITGYLLYRTKRQVNIPKVLNLLGWLVAACMNIAVLYGLYNPDNKHVLIEPESAAYTALSRTAWAIGVCWVVFACATGNGGPINTLLSWSPFVPLSRLTYCAYLVHPVIMLYIYGMRRTAVYLAYPEMVCTFLGYLVIAYIVAFVISLAFESPMMGLEKAIFRQGRK
ncbi:hypothetical protein CHS0354_032680 [Potamilus streckersoni]|uniref:Nose resistant-to-fluoxetine protein N-terminal domain-containing protein n=1 Tax=Potamilus streckersoni TaxID=2493646 RepID=A0AAE0VX38_9BIVA|nr:hypothetical protein CHS0354_032680 [Potamilus streckersoni]